MDAGPAGRMWPYRLAVLVLPMMVLWHQDNSLFTPPGQIDSWVYFGFFRNLVNFKRELFPGTYYGSRLSWILPGWLVHTVFPPVFASAVLHLGVLWTASLALFETLRLTAGARAAFLTTLVFSANPQVWYATGWDYFDGIGIAYCLLTMALFTGAAAWPGRRWMLVLAGTAMAGLVYSNLLLTTFVPLLLLYYAGLARVWNRASVRALLKDLCLRTGGGFLLVTMAFCVVNYFLDGTFWFYRPSFDIMPKLIHTYGWDRQPWTSHGLIPWLWFTAVAAAGALSRVARALRRGITARSVAPLLYSIQLLALLAMYAYLQPRRISVLGLPFYSAMLLPFAFLIIGSTFWRAAAEMSVRAYALLCGTAVIAFGTAWYDYAGDWIPIWPEAVWPAASLGVAALAAALMLRRRAWGMLLAITGFAVFSAEVRYIPKTQNSTAARVERPESPHAHRRMLERLMESRAWIESERRNRVVRFWYSPQDPAIDDYKALNATYLYLYTLMTKPFPEVVCDESTQREAVVVALSARENAADLARGVLSGCPSRVGLRARLIGSRTVPHPKGVYTAVLVAIEPDRSTWRRVRPVFDSTEKVKLELSPYSWEPIVFPPERWTALEPGLGTRLRREGDGVELRTPAVAKASAAAYGQLVAPESGLYTFTMRYRLRSGQFAFGVRAGDGVRWLATDVAGHPAGSDMERECSVDLVKGQEVRIEIANNNAVDVPASLAIKELHASVR